MEFGFNSCVKGHIFDEYFYLDGISRKPKYTIYSQKGRQFTLERGEQLGRKGGVKLLLTLAKIISYLTLIFPMIMFIGKLYVRNHFVFLVKKDLTVADKQKLFPKELLESLPSINEESGTKVLTYNVMGKYLSGVADNSTEKMKKIAQNIIAEKPDIVCLQEVRNDQKNKLQEELALSKYSSTPVALDNRGAKPSGVAIFYNKERFKLLAKSINQKISTTNGAQKAFIVVDLQDQKEKKIVRVASCHLEKSIEGKQVLDPLFDCQVRKPDQIVIGGDMGLLEGDKPFSSFLDRGLKLDKNMEGGTASSQSHIFSTQKAPVHSQGAKNFSDVGGFQASLSAFV